jgi:hypothetical protein
MRQIDIDNVEIAWQNLCDAVKKEEGDDAIMDAMMDMAWTLETLVNACQTVVDEQEVVA